MNMHDIEARPRALGKKRLVSLIQLSLGISAGTLALLPSGAHAQGPCNPAITTACQIISFGIPGGHSAAGTTPPDINVDYSNTANTMTAVPGPSGWGAIQLESQGGAGGDANVDQGNGGAGAMGSNVTVNVGSGIVANGQNAGGILRFTSQGGNGGGGEGDGGIEHPDSDSPGTGGMGGGGGVLDVTMNGKVSSTDPDSAGLYVLSTGGSTDGGAEGGDGYYAAFSGDAGGSNKVTVNIGGSISTAGAGAVISALGGHGVTGANDTDGFVAAIGRDGGVGGNSVMPLQVNFNGTIISTAGDGLDAVARAGDGGDGGKAGDANQVTSGSGGAGGFAPTATVAVTGGDIVAATTTSPATNLLTTSYSVLVSTGVTAQSVGGNGGTAGVASGSDGKGADTIGGDGGAGGYATAATLTIDGGATVTGGYTVASALSVGGAGGVGASAGGSSGTGGNGGAGGAGGTAQVAVGSSSGGSASVIGANGQNVTGVLAASYGGAGGAGAAYADGITYANGGSGADGGSAAAATATIGAAASVKTYGVDNAGSVTQSGVQAQTTTTAGVSVQSNGGAGGGGGKDVAWTATAAHAGRGGAGGVATAVINGSVSTTGSFDFGVLAQSTGGMGGAGGDSSSLFSSHGGAAANGGGAGNIYVSGSNGTITTGGAGSTGILAQSIGGGGGAGGNALAFEGVAIGGNGGAGGDGAAVSVGINCTDSVSAPLADIITTTGNDAAGIIAQSVGGGGGNGGSALSTSLFSALAIGGDGKGGAKGGSVTVQNDGVITTFGSHSGGVQAQSVGGGGGNGGAAVALAGGAQITTAVAVGGDGAGGGDGSYATVTNTQQISTYGANSYGMKAQSISGGGGQGGKAMAAALNLGGAPDVPTVTATVGVGGTGGAGGDLSGIWTTAVNSGLITTAGDGSIGIIAQSVAGGGGDGGDATASSYVNTNGNTAITATASVGGAAGNGGTGGSVQVSNTGAIITTGADAYGVYAQSVGGGGGIGGTGDVSGGSVGGGDSYSGTITVGGNGGTGSAGGNVIFNPNHSTGGGSIATGGDGANAIFAQSVGGGGGASGGGTAKGNNGDVSLNVNLGGNAGAGGTGGTVSVTNNNVLLTRGADADAIFAQSVGGSGGKAGKGASTLGGSQSQATLSKTLQTTLSNGLNSGTGNAQSLGNGAYKIANQAWNGIDSVADLENVLGGVGSPAGLRDDEDDDGTATNLKLNATIGGQGGSGGTGNTVTVVNYQAIGTDGARSDGIFAQSVGGGGGSGGATSFSASSSGGGDDDDQTSGKLTLGGNGVSGGDGGSVNVNNGNPITTKGVSSYGIDAQSIGGGGGKAGTTASKQGALKDMSVTVGGSGGAGGDGMDVTVNSDGLITTSGREAFGILAQSIGGGGGNAHVLSSDIGAVTNDGDIQLTATIGGSGGAGGKGNTVLVTAGTNYAGSINTSGADAIGIVAQSIGGGGGTLTATGATNDDTQNDGIQHTTLVPLTIGDKNGSSGDANTVTVTYGYKAVTTPSAITTQGAGAYGILAQSIGGGGGLFLGATPSTSMSNLFGGSKQVGNGGTVDVTLQNQASVTTSGAGAVGVFAQSIGGGGGVFGSMQDVNLATGWQAPSTTENGQGGNVNVTLQGGAHVTTTGADAHGIFAQAAGGGGGMIGGASGAGYVFGGATPFSGCSGSACTGNVAVNVQDHSSVSVSGSGAWGVYAISRGNGSNNVNVTVDSTAAVTATGSAAGGIYMQSPNTSTFDNFGLVDDGTATKGGVVSSGGMAIVSPGAVTVVNHQGATLNGNASLGGGTITNEQGATVQATSLAFAGNHGAITNAGTLEVGGRKPTSLQVNGDLAQTSTGRIVFDADMVGNANDQLKVAGDATLAGSLQVRPISLSIGTMKVIDVAGAMDVSQLGVTNPFLVKYSLASQGVAASSDGHQSVYLTPHANFAGAALGLTNNEQAVAAHLQQNFDAGALAMGTSFAALANGVQNATQYKAALDTLGNEAQQAVGVARVAASQAFVERMNSCPSFDGSADTMMHERDCFWARAIDNSAGLGGDGRVGYSSSNHSFQIGGQRAIADGWFLGGSVAYDNSTVTSNAGGGNVKGDGGELGVVLKRELGNWTFSGSADVGRGSYDTQRYIGFPGYATRAQGNFHLDQEGLHARIAYLVPEEHWYLKPFVDLNAVHVHTTGYSEKGAGALGLEVSSASDTMHSVSPMLEAGGRWDLANGMTLRPYVAIGGAWYDRNRWGASSQFEGAAPGVDSFTSLSTAPTHLSKANVGMDWSINKNVQVRLEYDGQFAEHYHDNEGVLRVNYQF